MGECDGSNLVLGSATQPDSKDLLNIAAEHCRLDVHPPTKSARATRETRSNPINSADTGG
jgi:hypothetical protein